IFTRDPWMHRADIARATGTDLVLTAGHDGVLVAVAPGASGGPLIETGAVELCRVLAGRGHPAGRLAVHVPVRPNPPPPRAGPRRPRRGPRPRPPRRPRRGARRRRARCRRRAAH